MATAVTSLIKESLFPQIWSICSVNKGKINTWEVRLPDKIVWRERSHHTRHGLWDGPWRISQGGGRWTDRRIQVASLREQCEWLGAQDYSARICRLSIIRLCGPPAFHDAGVRSRQTCSGSALPLVSLTSLWDFCWGLWVSKWAYHPSQPRCTAMWDAVSKVPTQWLPRVGVQ